MKTTTVQYHITGTAWVWQTLIPALLLCMLAKTSTQAQQDLGEPTYSKLTWDQIRTAGWNTYYTIGLTTDSRMYVWGTNYQFGIHTRAVPITSSSPPGEAIAQTTPYYLPSPAGEKVVKVAAAATNVYLASGSALSTVPIFGCLTESGKLYGWGFNTGMFANAASGWAPIPSGTSFTTTDTTLAKRTPQQLTILGESNFVDFDFSSFANFWVAIGASGKAYHIGDSGNTASGGGATYANTFAAIPLPAGVDASTFKYVRVWCPTGKDTQSAQIYLKGNNGNIYFSGIIGYGMAMGVPAYYSDANTNTFPDAGGSPPSLQRDLRTDIPQLVPFPAGEDIVKIEFSGGTGRISEISYAISASGKAFATGFWGMGYKDIILSNYTNKRYFAYPLARSPVPGTELAKTVIAGDTAYTLKRFVEIAMPASATKIIDIDDFGPSGAESDRQWRSTLIVTNENKAYWAGRQQSNYYIFPNYLQYSDPYLVAKCEGVGIVVTNSQTQWSVEAINYRGIAKMNFLPSDMGGNGNIQRFIISKSGRGYFEGLQKENSGVGKINVNGGFIYQPIPIANEQLDSCNPSPGTGGAGGNSTGTASATGVINCAKTQLAPAPVVGVLGQTGLIVTIAVSATGTFSPLTVSGSGMSVANGIVALTAAATGTQQFYIPLQYDGSALGTLNFTIGTATNAGSCAANLSSPPKQAITNIWTLDCVPTVGPSLK